MKHPGGLNARAVLFFVKLHACVLSESGEEDDKMAAERTGPTDTNVDVIYTFNISEEGFNGVSSIKTDIYYRLEWLWFAATSIKINGREITAGPTRSTFQNKPQVSFRIYLSSLSSRGLTDPIDVPFIGVGRHSFPSRSFPNCLASYRFLSYLSRKRIYIVLSNQSRIL